MIKFPKARWLLASLLLVLAVVALFFLLKPEIRFELPNGGAIVLRSVQVGQTNIFKHGTSFEKLAGNLIPAKGLQVGTLKLQRPLVVNYFSPDRSKLTVEFEFVWKNGNPPAMMTTYSQFRIVHSGDDGFLYSSWFSGFRPYHDSHFGWFDEDVFSRTSQTLHFQLQKRKQYRDPWEEIARFSVANPTPAVDARWPFEDYPVRRTNGQYECSLGEVLVYRADDDRSHYIAPYNTRIPFQLKRGGEILTNWTTSGSVNVEDSTGNRLSIRTVQTATNDWLVFSGYRSADPQATWRMRAHFSPESDIPASNIFVLHLPWPLKVPYQTNLAGFPIAVSMMDDETFRVSMPTNALNTRILFQQAVNDSGEELTMERRSWLQHEFSCTLDQRSLRKVTNGITATIAVVEDVEFEFTVKPRLVDQLPDLTRYESP